MPHFRRVKFNELISVHPASSRLVHQSHTLVYTANINDIDVYGLSSLLRIHPIHVVNYSAEEKHKYHVIAGFRQYELLSSIYASPDFQKIKDISPLNEFMAIVHDNLEETQIWRMAIDDLAGSPLLFSLGSKVAEQLTYIKSVVGPYGVTGYPKYGSGRKMADREPVKSDDNNRV